MAESNEHQPLTEAVYYILLALHTPMHGYGVMQFTKEISNGRLSLGPGTLYGAIKTMLERGWIQALETEADSRKKEYEITLAGRKVVQNEIDRLQELVKNGNSITRGE
ncbi:PadR family transcriptional regulator [Psychrobacillus insolitus]|uniref:PadR family transcriptional regulator n=1 Tax=Psychrobacillus insolitus TaxID=1461 RepID=A0A2W7MEZ9_9BACI|nr:helix-turn-helix transcriptional regulator [Psychrobacillus insolitus]PZX02883.1 PadR family transcriptional regulator [Psychrobacillus insolitus]